MEKIMLGPQRKYDQPNYRYPLNVGQVGQEPYVVFDIKDSVIQDKPPSKAFIFLYMPATISTRYGANYQELSDWQKLVTNEGEGLLSGFSDSARQGLKDIGSFLTQSMTGGTARSQLEFLDKKLINPHMTQAFTGMAFRQIQFEFNMLARNLAESEQINNIIYTFKLHMHPNVKNDTGDTSRFLTYPEHFIISLYSPNDKYLFKMKKSALVDMSVNYAGSGIPTFFDGSGAPVDIRMNLTFTELIPLTKTSIEEGA